MKKLYLVDVSSMYFRAFYAIRPLSNKSGMPTNALYGFLSMSVKLLKDVSPDYMAFCFDRKDPSFRKEMYEDYKANRTEMPEDLVPQVPYVRKLTEALGIPAYDLKSFEADDLIGTLTEIGRKNNLEVVIVSGDKDFAQLVGPFVSMLDTMKDIKYDTQGVVDKWGIEPSQVIDFLALVGDSSDNVPGVRGIGEKGAQKLLAEFKTLDGIYENLNVIKGSMHTKLVDGKEMAYLSKKLVTIKTDIDMGVKLEDLKLKPLPEQQLKDLLEELDFKSFERRIFGAARVQETATMSGAPTSAKKVESVEDKTQSTDDAVLNSSTTTPLMAQQSSQMSMLDVAGAGAAIGEEEIEPNNIGKIIKAGHELWGLPTDRGLYIGYEQNVYRLTGEMPALAKALDQLNVKWKGFDLKSFWHQLGVTNPIALWDGALAAYVLRAGEVGDFNEVYQKSTGMALPELASPAQILAAYQNYEKIAIERVRQTHNESLYLEFDLPLATVLYKMEQRGILLDVDLLKKQSREAEKDMHKVEKEIFATTGHTFSLNSPKQLGEVLFNKMKMPVIRKTKTGFSTDSDVLMKLSEQYPICLKIIEYRELAKLKSTYLDALPLLVDARDGRLHTRFHQHATSTGRLSSLNPNLQNIPIRTPRGAQIREAFVVPQGKSLVSADYSQIELRILAHITQDPGLIQAFENDQDIHAATASEVFDIPINEVTANHRRVAKAVNFGIAYGMGSFGLSENLSISVEEANDIIKKYFNRFAKVREYMDDTIELAKKQGYVETIFGRRRYLDELKAKNANIRKFGERAAINAPMQGTASDIVKKAMIDIEAVLPNTMLLQVHDELIFEVENSEVEKAKMLIHDKMENVVKLRVPLKVNIAIGPNWDAAH